jgi:small-conductance mechanosensitive channel
MQVRSDLAMRVREGLAAAGIELALPQRDLRLRRQPQAQPGDDADAPADPTTDPATATAHNPDGPIR